MSGGRFDYMQYRIVDIAEDIETVIKDNGRQRSFSEVKEDRPWITREMYDEGVQYSYSPETVRKMKEAYGLLRAAYVYAQRIDYLLSGDDSEESFNSRLDQEMSELEAELNKKFL